MPSIFQSIPNLPAQISLELWEFSEDLSFFTENTSFHWQKPLVEKKMIPQKLKESLACRYLLQKELNSDSSIDFTPSGKPFLLNGPHFSFSHTQHFSAVATSKIHEIGIDMEENHRSVSKIAGRFLNEEELEILQTEDLQRLAWCMKEAMYKSFGAKGLDFKKEIEISEQDGEFVGHIKFKEKETNFSLFWSIENRLTICVAVPNLPTI